MTLEARVRTVEEMEATVWVEAWGGQLAGTHRERSGAGGQTHPSALEHAKVILLLSGRGRHGRADGAVGQAVAVGKEAQDADGDEATDAGAGEGAGRQFGIGRVDLGALDARTLCARLDGEGAAGIGIAVAHELGAVLDAARRLARNQQSSGDCICQHHNGGSVGQMVETNRQRRRRGRARR